MDRPIGRLTAPDGTDHEAGVWSTGFVTERLVATALRASDAEDLFPVLADPSLYRYVGGAPPASVDALRDRYGGLESRRSPDGGERWWSWTLRTKTARRAIGYVQATLRPSEIELAWVVGASFQGEGYAKEAVSALVRLMHESLPSHDVVASIHPEHGASVTVARFAGLAPTRDLDDGEVVWRLPHG